MMKKFITYVAQQPENMLRKGIYSSESNELLNFEKEASFPVIPMINGYASGGDTIEIIAMLEENNANGIRNLEVLKTELEELGKSKGFGYEIRVINVSGKEVAKEHLRTFESLLNAVDENDELFVCATYGTKPVPIIEMMAVNAAYKIKKGVTVKCVAYGGVTRDEKGAVTGMSIYDITPLFFMTRLVDTLAAHPLEDPEAVIKRVLEDEEDE